MIRGLSLPGTPRPVAGYLFTLHKAIPSPFGVQVVESPRISRQLAHEGGKVVTPYVPVAITTGDNTGTRFC